MRSIIVVAALALAVGVLAPRYFSNIGPRQRPRHGKRARSRRLPPRMRARARW
jgi:hypothetical protein